MQLDLRGRTGSGRAGWQPSAGWQRRGRREEAAVKLELSGITKRFGSLVANDHIDLTVQPGEIRALLGENGAGKTTLMNVLYGLIQPDEGEIRVDDRAVVIHSPKDAIAARIGMVHQHFMLVPVFTVAENVTLGLERTRRVRPARPAAGPPGRTGALRALRPGRRPGRLRRGSAGRRAAAGRDHQGPAARGQRARPRRADVRADAGRDRGPVPDHARAQGGRPVDRLHLAQAQGGPGDRRHDHGHPAREGRRRAAADRDRHRARRADGGPGRAAAGQQGPGHARRCRA